MRLLFSIIVAFIVHSAFGQSVVYKKNPLTGQLEVYKSQGGFPVGSPIYKIKKNLWGYLEIEDVETSINPFSKKPDYAAYNNFKPYQLPAKEIFETIETLNKRYEYDYMVKQPTNNSPEYQKELDRTRQWFQNRSSVASAFLKFYQNNFSFPKRLEDGWYEVVNIYDIEEFKGANIPGGYSYEHGICKVENNRVIEYYKNCNIFDLKTGYVFQKIKIDVSSAVSAYKASFRPFGTNTYTTIYFMDNILDSSKQIANPNFSFYSIFTSSNLTPTSNLLLIQIARNKAFTREEALNLSGGPYQATFQNVNPATLDCSNSLLTIAFRKTEDANDKFSIAVSQISDEKIWLINDLTFLTGTCTAITLNQ